ncbi:hypothetical protein KJS94_12585 [Flavihumibacter rivuli]|uniref:hypothetical protein n=1 Tax=Flavihumibacter rivuli TaxID=2838156 RepID=UPI001BDE26A2|nr:hypothetical protein [Flavihumibacter rivuli]ULQ55480.1 hypothetical protein KJS94_12585 [Flavihumibacter rivuli]
MKKCLLYFLISATCMALLTACGTVDKVSKHGFNSGYYKFYPDNKSKDVYADISEEKIDLYEQVNKKPAKEQFLSIKLKDPDSLLTTPLKFKKQSLDIDITSVLLKYRPSVNGLPPQLTTDLNIAIYAGWRFDNYKITSKKDPLGRPYQKLSSLGYDFGFFAGPGTTPVNPFTTNNRTGNDYNGMILQGGFAGFIETSFVSFGLAVGFDYLLNSDRKIWIYNNKPWLGFVVGVAIN